MSGMWVIVSDKPAVCSATAWALVPCKMEEAFLEWK